MAARVVSSREYAQAYPFPGDQVSVRGIRYIANSGFDVWGREKEQPVDVSSVIDFGEGFASAAANDKLDGSTVHYGQLSKDMISILEQRDMSERQWESVLGLADRLLFAVLAVIPDHSIIVAAEVELVLLKASRFGEGVGITVCHHPAKQLISIIMSLRRLKVAALIGVNDHERATRQMVVASVSIDRIDSRFADTYFELEEIVVKTIEESSYETLEALTEEIASRTIKYYVYAKQHPDPTAMDPAGVRVRVEKPSAVTWADAPAVEIYRSAEPQDPYGKRIMGELGTKKPVIPFPLDGRLDEFLKSWKQD